MAQYRGLDFLDYLVLMVKWKRFLIILTLMSLLFGYLAVYFLIPPQYDSSATIVATEDTQMNPLSAMAGGLSDLPLNFLGFGGMTSSAKYDLFTTIIYSRTNLERMIDKFELKNDYGIESTEKTIKLLKSLIKVEITDELAYGITIRSVSPEKSAEMTNYLVEIVNKDVIELNVKKAQENRKFLEDRYNEVLTNLSNAEDSLRLFMERTGMLEAENQTKSIIEMYAKLESDLAVKQIELAVTEKVIGKTSQQANNLRLTVQEFKNRINDYIYGKGKNNILLPLNELPQNILEYYRYFRAVEISNAMIGFIIPLYEQAKFEEVKAVPVLQIIDYAVPPEKKNYPPRTLYALLLTIVVFSIATLIIFLRELLKQTSNEKVKFIRSEAFNFKKGK
jgi:tyrosine-protein kinase Etk/Wzc